MNSKGSMLILGGLMVVASAMTPAGVWIRMFATLALSISIMAIFHGRIFMRVLPKGIFLSGIVHVFVRGLQIAVKYPGEIFYAVRDSLSFVLHIFVPVFLLFTLVAFVDYKQFRRFVILTILIILPFLLITICSPVGASRLQMAVAQGISEFAAQEVVQVTRSGVMMYPQIHTLPFILIASIFLFKNLTRKYERMAMGLVAIIALSTIVRSGFGFAIGFSFVCALMVMVGFW